VKMTDEYAAGVIDARGRIRTGFPGSESFVPLLRVTTTDQILAEELCKHFGGGGLKRSAPTRNPNSLRTRGRRRTPPR
jgi:hypothetical protein